MEATSVLLMSLPNADPDAESTFAIAKRKYKVTISFCGILLSESYFLIAYCTSSRRDEDITQVNISIASIPSSDYLRNIAYQVATAIPVYYGRSRHLLMLQ